MVKNNETMTLERESIRFLNTALYVDLSCIKEMSSSRTKCHNNIARFEVLCEIHNAYFEVGWDAARIFLLTSPRFVNLGRMRSCFKLVHNPNKFKD
jgi:hypothetical protein